MPTNNTIVILETRDGFYVSHVQNLESILKEGEINDRDIFIAFRNSERFDQPDEAEKYAVRLEMETGFVEHGLIHLTGMKHRYFPVSCCSNMAPDSHCMCMNCGVRL